MKRRKMLMLSMIAAFALAVCGAIATFPTADSAKAETPSYDKVYDFTTVTDLSTLTDLKVGFDPQDNNETYASDSWVTYDVALDTAFDLDGGLKVDKSVYSGNDVSGNRIYVRVDSEQVKYYKAELVYSYDDADVNGWAGFMFGYTNFARRAQWGDSPSGFEVFVQKEGKGTASSAKLNNSGYSEQNTPANWTELGEHTLTITVDDKAVVLTADGTEVYKVTAEELTAKAYETVTANMGFFFTNAQFTAKKFSYSKIEVQEPVAPDSSPYPKSTLRATTLPRLPILLSLQILRQASILRTTVPTSVIPLTVG